MMKNTNPKLAHITPSFLPAFGGQENCILSLVLRHAAEWDVHVIAGAKARAMHGDAYRVHNLLPLTWPLILARTRIGRPFLFAQLGRYQRKFQFEVWDAHFMNIYGRAIAEYALRHRIPCVWSVHEFSCVRYVKAFYHLFPDMVEQGAELPLVIVSGAKHLADQVNELGKLTALYVPRGLDHARFASVPPADRQTRHAFELVTIGRNVPEKQLQLSVEALQHLLNDGHADIGLTIITHDISSLTRDVESRGMQEHVRLLRSGDLQGEERFCIPPSGAIAEFKAADGLISMGLYEASPNVVLEGLAAHLPVIVSDTDAHREVITDGVNGLLVSPPDSARALAEAMLKLKQDVSLRETLRENGIKTGLERDWDRSAEGYAAAYRLAMRRGEAKS